MIGKNQKYYYWIYTKTVLKFLCNIFLFLIIYILKKYCKNILDGDFDMKKEKVEQDEKKEDVELIEVENFEVSKTGSLADDLMKFENVKDIKIEKNIWIEIKRKLIL